jgi:toxin YoeB
LERSWADHRVQVADPEVEHGLLRIGKPEPLKHDFAGYWSRRITDEHRLVHKVTETEVRVAACRYHDGR